LLTAAGRVSKLRRMRGDSTNLPGGAGQLWPCGRDCIHAGPLPGPDFGWLRCTHPLAQGGAGHRSLDCPRFDSRPETRTLLPGPRDEWAA